MQVIKNKMNKEKQKEIAAGDIAFGAKNRAAKICRT
jgi:hypothetical protein